MEGSIVKDAGAFWVAHMEKFHQTYLYCLDLPLLVKHSFITQT